MYEKKTIVFIDFEGTIKNYYKIYDLVTYNLIKVIILFNEILSTYILWH